MMDKWIPITYRDMTEEEKVYYAERTGYDKKLLDLIINCKLPDDGEEVLITDSLGYVQIDTFINDNDGCCFENHFDMDEVIAWQPLPEPFKPQESEV